MSGALRWIACGCLAASLAWASGAWGARAAGLTSLEKPLQDGCQRNASGVIFLQTPEWVYVNRDPSLRIAQGVVRVSHVARDDAPGEHASHDYNANLVLGGADRYLLGGDPVARTGNFAPGDPEQHGRLHIEWESGVVPSYVWPSDGDTAKVWGSWIWDCGHWTGPAGNVTGERTELHPLTALAVTRRAPYRPRTTQSETDVFISSEGTGARAVEQCALHLRPVSSTRFGPDFRACVQKDESANIAHNAPQPIAGRYSFFVPAPPRPSPGARLTYRVVRMIAHSSGRERIQATSSGLRVTVTLAGRPTEAAPIRYGKSFFVGWSGRQRTRPTPLRVTFNTLTIHHADPGLTDPSGGKWNLYLDLDGYRQLFNDWLPRLAKVTDGEVLRIKKSVNINLPAGRYLELLVFGRECDIPSGKVVFGELGPVVAPCPVNTDEPQIVFSNDDPGIVLDIYRSVRAALGTHISASVATTSRFPGSPPISFGDGKQGQDAYELSYTVSRR